MYISLLIILIVLLPILASHVKLPGRQAAAEKLFPHKKHSARQSAVMGAIVLASILLGLLVGLLIS